MVAIVIYPIAHFHPKTKHIIFVFAFKRNIRIYI